jgi:hypothetical protein
MRHGNFIALMSRRSVIFLGRILRLMIKVFWLMFMIDSKTHQQLHMTGIVNVNLQPYVVLSKATRTPSQDSGKSGQSKNGTLSSGLKEKALGISTQIQLQIILLCREVVGP